MIKFQTICQDSFDQIGISCKEVGPDNGYHNVTNIVTCLLNKIEQKKRVPKICHPQGITLH